MAAAFAFSPAAGVAYSPVTITLSGFANSTAYIVQVTRGSGGSQSIPVTTDGSGGATCTFTPAGPGTHTVTAIVAPAASVASGTFSTSGN